MKNDKKQRIVSFCGAAVFGIALAAYASNDAGAIHAARGSAARQSVATTAGQGHPEEAFGRKVKVDGVRNFGEVTPTLYRGGQPNGEGLRKLADMGVNVIVDLRETGRGRERKEVAKLGMQFVEIPWQCFIPKDEDMARFLALLRQDSGKKVFVHCTTGSDRTGMEIAAYRMAEQGWTAKQARAEMEAFGFNSFHQRICPGLGAYQTRFPERFAAQPGFQELRELLHGPGAQR